MNTRPTVSVIVPHYRDFERLDLFLAALCRQTYPGDRVEIIVADNASPEGEDAVARTVDGRARVVISPEKGAAPMRNGAVAIGEILAFTDSDCQPEVDWLTQGVEASIGCDFAGGRVKVLIDDVAHMKPSEAFERVFAYDNKTYVTCKGSTVTANLFCPRLLFAKIGGFRLGMSEDIEWSFRAGKAGYRIGYAPLAVVGHPARRLWPELESKWRRVNVEIYGLMNEQQGGRLHWLARSALLPVSAVLDRPRVLFSSELNSIGQRLSALGMLYRLRLWRFVDSLRLLTRTRDA